jgi:hypothetical protein
MLSNAFNALQGKKTYVLAALGAVVAVVGHFWGPLSLAGQTIPAITSDDMWKAIWAVASLASVRHGISTSNGGTPS